MDTHSIDAADSLFVLIEGLDGRYHLIKDVKSLSFNDAIGGEGSGSLAVPIYQAGSQVYIEKRHTEADILVDEFRAEEQRFYTAFEKNWSGKNSKMLNDIYAKYWLEKVVDGKKQKSWLCTQIEALKSDYHWRDIKENRMPTYALFKRTFWDQYLMRRIYIGSKSRINFLDEIDSNRVFPLFTGVITSCDIDRPFGGAHSATFSFQNNGYYFGSLILTRIACADLIKDILHDPTPGCTREQNKKSYEGKIGANATNTDIAEAIVTGKSDRFDLKKYMSTISGEGVVTPQDAFVHRFTTFDVIDVMLSIFGVINTQYTPYNEVDESGVLGTTLDIVAEAKKYESSAFEQGYGSQSYSTLFKLFKDDLAVKYEGRDTSMFLSFLGSPKSPGIMTADEFSDIDGDLISENDAFTLKEPLFWFFKDPLIDAQKNFLAPFEFKLANDFGTLEGSRETIKSLVDRVMIALGLEMWWSPSGQAIVQIPRYDNLPILDNYLAEDIKDEFISRRESFPELDKKSMRDLVTQYDHGKRYLIGDDGYLGFSQTHNVPDITYMISEWRPYLLNWEREEVATFLAGIPDSGQYPFLLEMQHRFGVRIARADKLYVQGDVPSSSYTDKDGAVLKDAWWANTDACIELLPKILESYAATLVAANLHHNYTGSLDLSFRPDLHLGKTVWLLDNNVVGYINARTYNYQYPRAIKTSYDLTYLRPPFEPIGVPWLELLLDVFGVGQVPPLEKLLSDTSQGAKPEH